MANWNQLNRVDVGAQTCGAVTRSASTSCAFGCWTLRSRPAIWCSSSPPPIPTWATDRSVFFPFFFSSSISSVYVSPVVSARVRILHSIHQRPTSQIFFSGGRYPNCHSEVNPLPPWSQKKWFHLPFGVIYPQFGKHFPRGRIGCD